MDTRAARFIENLAKQRRELADEVVARPLEYDKYRELQVRCALLQELIAQARAHFKGEEDDDDEHGDGARAA